MKETDGDFWQLFCVLIFNWFVYLSITRSVQPQVTADWFDVQKCTSNTLVYNEVLRTVLVFYCILSFSKSFLFLVPSLLFPYLPTRCLPTCQCLAAHSNSCIKLVISSCMSLCGFVSCWNCEEVSLTLHFSGCKLNVSSHCYTGCCSLSLPLDKRHVQLLNTLWTFLKSAVEISVGQDPDSSVNYPAFIHHYLALSLYEYTHLFGQND